MKNYFFLQLKRQIKLLPLVLTVTFVLFVGISTILTLLINMFNSSEDQQLFKIAISGDTDSEYIGLGLTAVQTIDDTRFTIEFLELKEEEAKAALKSGNISAYVVLPENFIDNAIAGNVDKIRFVTTAGDRGITTMLKNELTTLITDMVVYSQKGTYGLNDALKDNDTPKEERWKLVDDISIEYVELVFHRNDMIKEVVIGISDGLSTSQYYLCGMTVLLLMLIGIPFASVCVRRDNSLESLLVSRGYSVRRQILSEYFAHFCILTGVALFMTVCIRYMPNIIELIGNEDLISEMSIPFVLRIIVSVALLSAMNIFIFELVDNLVSGVLLHFFTVLALGYVSGLFYPIYSFPAVIQKLSCLLPTGILRSFMSGIFADETSLASCVLGIMIYLFLFLAGTAVLRHRKLAGNRG
ncbi:MAG: ABC transporter permease [Clostridia bacterium]|nr:ABC transporter permease [Clostridia bacterium]